MKRTSHTLKETEYKKQLWDRLYESDMSPIKDKPVVPLTCANNAFNECEQCRCSLMTSDEGFLVCTNSRCCLVYSDVLDHGAEWRFYGLDQNGSDPTRCGMPTNPNLRESSLGCSIMSNAPMTFKMRKIQQSAMYQSMPSNEKTQFRDFHIITTMLQQANIPKMLIDEAIAQLKIILENDCSGYRKGKKTGRLAASIYMAFRKHGCPRTPKEIADIFHLNQTHVSQGCKKAMMFINDFEREEHNQTDFQIPTADSFIERYCSKLNMNPELTNVCLFVAKNLESTNVMSEHTPPSIASGVIQFVAVSCGIHISKKDIGCISQISEVTINKCFKKIEMISLTTPLIPNIILNKYKTKG